MSCKIYARGDIVEGEMEKKRRFAFNVLLYLGAVFIVALISSAAISWYLGTPIVPSGIVSILPGSLKEKFVPSPAPTPTPGVSKPTSVTKVTLKNGQYFYEIHGRFPTNPYYQKDILRGEFVIDEDPYNQRLPVIMTAKTGKINVGRSKGNFAGTTVWKLESTEALKSAIVPNQPVQLRIQFFSTVLSEHDRLVKKTLDAIIEGKWSIPDGFVFIPVMVGVVE